MDGVELELVCPCGYENFERVVVSANLTRRSSPTSWLASAARPCTGHRKQRRYRPRDRPGGTWKLSAGLSGRWTARRRWSATQRKQRRTTASRGDPADA